MLLNITRYVAARIPWAPFLATSFPHTLITMAHTIGTFSRSVRLVSRTTLQQAMRTRAPVARTLAARAQPAGSSTSVFASALVPVAGVVAAGLAYAWTLQDEHGAEVRILCGVLRVCVLNADAGLSPFFLVFFSVWLLLQLEGFVL